MTELTLLQTLTKKIEKESKVVHTHTHTLKI